MATGQATDELQLILELKSGRTDAAGELMNQHGERLMRYLVSILGNREAAEDAFQESWIKVMEKIGSFHEDAGFEPWLFRIARNTAYDALRSKRRWWLFGTGSSPQSEDPAIDFPDPTDFGSRVVARQSVKRLLKSLSPEFREVLFLRFIQEKSYQEIAEFCRLPLGTVKSRLKRGLDSLAKSLGEK